MAEKIPPHGMAYYNQRGQYVWCHTDADVVNAKKDGYSSSRYVQSKWPTTAFNKKTGASKSVGRTEWSETQNQEAVTALGPEWGLEHVAVPEAKPKTEVPEAVGLGTLAELMMELKTLGQRVDEMKDKVDGLGQAAAAAQFAIDQRVSDLESAITAAHE